MNIRESTALVLIVEYFFVDLLERNHSDAIEGRTKIAAIKLYETDHKKEKYLGEIYEAMTEMITQNFYPGYK